MNAHSPDQLRHETNQTLDYLHESKRSLEATIAAARRAIETSRTVMREADAKRLPPAHNAD